MWNLRNTGISHLIYKAELATQMQRTNVWMPGEAQWVMNWEIGIDIYTLLILTYKGDN